MNPVSTPSIGGLGVDLTNLPSQSDPSGLQQQFESVFYSLIIKQLRSTLSEDGLFPGESTDSYGVLFDQFMGEHLAKAQPLGIGKMLARYQDAAATT